MIKWPKVTVVMSNYNGLKLNLLIEALSSILENDYSNLEVILVDNASTDLSVSKVKRKFERNPRLIVIQNPVNMYSQGLNLGIMNSTGKYIAFFNNDVVVENGYFQKFVRFLEKNSDIALSQGKLLSYFDHSIIDSVGETMDAFGTPINIGAGVKNYNKFEEIEETLSVSGSCSILRKSIIPKVGYFDEDYGIGYEDLDLALRIWRKGFRVVYFPKAIAFHKRGATDLAEEVRVKVRWHFNKNRIATLIKNYPASFLLKNLPVTLLIYTIAGLWEIVIKGKLALGFTRFSSLGWVLQNFPKILRNRLLTEKNSKKKYAKKIEDLLYKKTFLNSFSSFIKSK